MSFWVIQILSALSLGMLLFLLAAGLSMIFGLMRIINVAHGSFYLLGAYLGFEAMRWTNSFVVALIVGGAAMTVIGVVIQRGFIHRVMGNSLGQILMTFGFLLILGDVALIVWRGAPVLLDPPPGLDGFVNIGGIRFPNYRLFMIGIGLLVAVALEFFQQRTRVGAMIRAGADDLEMLNCMGYNVSLLFTAVFAFGALLAGLGGVLGSVFLGVYPGIDLEIGILAFVVVIVGGLGSVRGTLAASLLVGAIDNLSKALLPEISMFAIFLLMVFVLAVKPNGLFGKIEA
ncbi:MAG: branched-chain amino acid ABC transporter permease [Pseudorhodoplanes sp.]